MLKIFQYIFLCLFPIISLGHPIIQFDHLTTRDGLSQNSVLAILQDNFGFMWFGTRDGLNMYNGISMQVFNHDIFDENSLSNSHINHIAEDSQGNLWISTINGLTKFIRETETFKRYYIPDITEESYIFCTLEDNNGNLWVGTREGIYILDKKQNILVPFQFPANVIEKPGRLVKTIFEDQFGSIWFGTFSNGLYCYNPSNSTMLLFNTKSSPALNTNRAEDVIEDSEGNIWIGTYGGGVNVWDRSGNHIEYIIKKDTNGLSNNLVRTLHKDSNGDIWIGTFDGLNHFDSKTGIINVIFSEELDPHGLSNNSIRSIFEDEKGTIWIGTYFGGINIYDKVNQRFRHHTYAPDFKSSLNYNVVSSLAENKDLNLWIGTERGGLNFYDIRSRKYSFYKPNEPDDDESPIFTIKSILLYDEENLWLGTHRRGLYHFNTRSKTFTGIFRHTQQTHNLNNAIINFIHKDHEGYLWLCTETYGGLYKFDPERQIIVPFKMQDKVHDLIRQTPVRSVFQDSFGNMWVATRGKGIILFNNETGYFDHFYHDKMNPHSLLSNHIYQVMQDKDGNIWVVTYGAGIGVFNRMNQGFDFSISRKGLIHDKAFGMIEDGHGTLWITTNIGLSRLKKNDTIFRNYGLRSGLPISELTEGAFHIGRYSGKLFFGGIDGFFEIDPNYFADNDFIPPVLISGFRLFNQSVRPGDKTRILEKSMLLNDEITLRYNQSIFTIDFIALNYTFAYNNKYAYMLEGLENTWNYVDNQTFATYTLLNSGDYVFKVKASNNDGVWNEVPTTLKIKILPPPWKTWWAYVIYSIIIITLMYYIRYFILKNEQFKNSALINKIQQDKLVEINEAKIDFFTNLSHEFRTPLTLIIAPIRELIKNRGIKDEFRDKMNLILQNAQLLNRLADQLIDFRKLETGKETLKVERNDWVKVVKEVTSYFSHYAEFRNISFSFKSEERSVEGLVDVDLIEKALFNVISNAFKNTHEKGRIKVSVAQINLTEDPLYLNKKYPFVIRICNPLPIGKDLIVITVDDDGIGLNKEHLDRIFEKFYEIPDSLSADTGIGLYIVKNIVTLHHGCIEVSSEKNAGMSFSMIFPLEEDYYTPQEIIHTKKQDLKNHYKPLVPLDEIMDNVSKSHTPENAPNILVIEDNTDLSLYLISLLKDEYHISSATSIKDAWSKIRQIKPDVIICDQWLKNKNGLNFCKRIKKIRNLKSIPFILLTSDQSEENKILSYSAGIDAYFVKPFAPELIKIRIKNLLLQQKDKSQVISSQNNISNVMGPDEKLLIKINEIVRKKISDPKLNVESLGREVGLSRVQFYRKIKELTGLTAVEYIRSIRIEEAANILRQGKLSIKEVAGLTGFTDLDYFRNQFKKKFGLTPSAFMEVERKKA
jgi:ligand-binding sensor domain-containing protein/signal transduction histidine kinase/AraC-like DNA-binding protein